MPIGVLSNTNVIHTAVLSKCGSIGSRMSNTGEFRTRIWHYCTVTMKKFNIVPTFVTVATENKNFPSLFYREQHFIHKSS